MAGRSRIATARRVQRNRDYNARINQQWARVEARRLKREHDERVAQLEVADPDTWTLDDRMFMTGYRLSRAMATVGVMAENLGARISAGTDA